MYGLQNVPPCEGLAALDRRYRGPIGIKNGSNGTRPSGQDIRRDPHEGIAALGKDCCRAAHHLLHSVNEGVVARDREISKEECLLEEPSALVLQPDEARPSLTKHSKNCHRGTHKIE